MLITKLQESPGGGDVISHLLPTALTMRSGSISCTGRCSSGCWWLDGVLLMAWGLESLLCVPGEGQAAADTGSATALLEFSTGHFFVSFVM